MGDVHSNGGTGTDTLESLEAEWEDLEKTVACVRQMSRDFDALAEQRKSFDTKRVALNLQLKGGDLRRCVWMGFSTPEAFQWHKASMARKKALGEQLLQDTDAFTQLLIGWAENLEKREKQQQQLVLSPVPSTPIVTGGNALMPGEPGAPLGATKPAAGGALTDAQRNLLRQKNAEAVAIIARFGDKGEIPETPESLLDGPLKSPWGTNLSWMPGTPKWDLRQQYKGMSDEHIALMESTRRNGVRALTLLAQAGKLSKSQISALKLRGLGVLAEGALDIGLALMPYESIADLASMGPLGTTEVTVGAGVREFSSQTEETGENTVSEKTEAPVDVGPTIGNSGYRTANDFTIAVTTKYQALYDFAYSRIKGLVNQELFPNDQTAIGAEVDALARDRLRDWLFTVEGIKEGEGEIIAVNRRLYDPLGSGKYRVPDVYIPPTGSVLEGTISLKTGTSLQVQQF